MADRWRRLRPAFYGCQRGEVIEGSRACYRELAHRHYAQMSRDKPRESERTARPTLHIKGGAPSAIFYVVNATSESERHVDLRLSISGNGIYRRLETSLIEVKSKCHLKNQGSVIEIAS